MCTCILLLLLCTSLIYVLTICRDAEVELEVMWQAAHTENERMKDVLHRTVRQLRQHEALSDAMDRAEQKQIVHVSSDEQ